MASGPSRQTGGGGDHTNEPEVEDLDALQPRSVSSRSPHPATPRSGGGPVTVDALIALVHEVTTMKRELLAVKAEVAEANSHESQGHRPTQTGVDLAALNADLQAFKVEVSEKIKDILPDTEPEETHFRDGFVEGGIEVYEFNESVWDALLFLGHIRGAYQAVDMTLLGLINLLIQGWFCALLLTLRLADISDNVFRDNLFDFIQWRIGVAHQAEYYDPLTNTSLAQRVCLQYGGTIESRRHQTDFTTSETYYDFDEKDHSLLQGPGLLMLALALWLALILKEVVNILGFARMVLALTLNGTGGSKLKQQKDGDFEILSMSKRRAGFLVVCVMLPRLAIAMMLALVGTLYLRATFSVEEIILNAMALGFVLEIDELLFHFLPAAARYTLQHLQPVPLALNNMPWPKAEDSNAGGGASTKITLLIAAVFERTRVLFAILIVIVISFRFTIIQDIQDSMKMSQLILCEGTSHFVFKQHPMTRVLVLGNTVDTSGDSSLELPARDIQTVFDAVLQATGLCAELQSNKDVEERLGLCDGDKGMWCEPCRRLLTLPPSHQLFLNDTLTATLSLVSATQAEALASVACVDSYTSPNETWMREPILQLLRTTGVNITLGLCDEMKQHCLHASSAVRDVVRRYCPQACWCDHAMMDTVEKWYFNRIGCLPDCVTLVQDEVETLREDLVVGSKECRDEDTYLVDESTWATYVEDVQAELVKRGALAPTTDGLGLKPSAQIRAAFAAATKADFDKFHTSLVHSSNQPYVSIDGCSFPEERTIDLMAWARAIGSLCRFARMVQYVFNADLCSSALLTAGFTTLQGLCPVSCQFGPCSGQTLPDSFDLDQFAWYNILPWGRDAEFNMTCDRANLYCFEVDKMTTRQGWYDDVLTITNDTTNATLYRGTLEAQWNGDVQQRAQVDIVCLRPPSATNCYTIKMSSNGNFPDPQGVRWRLTELGTRQFLISGGLGMTATACGKDWVQDLGVPCKAGDTVTVMKSFAQMQIDGFLVANPGDELPDDPADYHVQGTERGMFAYRKSLLLGGYDGTSVTLEYLNAPIGFVAHELLAEIGKPLITPGLLAPSEGSYISPCHPSTSILVPDAISDGRSPLCNGTINQLSCSAFVEEVLCITPLSFVEHWFVERDCAWELEGFSETATVAELCPLSCKSQQTVPPPAQDPHAIPHYSDYYAFKPIGQLRRHCLCKWSQDSFWECQAEMGLTQTPFFNGDCDTPLEDYQRYADRVRSNTYCASVAMGFEERVGFPNLTKWCYVSPQCKGSMAIEDEYMTECAWRPASPEECATDPPDFDGYIAGVDHPLCMVGSDEE